MLFLFFKKKNGVDVRVELIYVNYRIKVDFFIV